MRNIRCSIVDDEPLALKLIENFIARTPFLELDSAFTDSVEAMTHLRKFPVDLVFLDIQMPEMDGMELSHVIPQQTRIIFTTAFKEYAFDSYDVAAIDFLLKPVRYDKFLRAAEKAREWFGRTACDTGSAPAAQAPAENPEPPNTGIFIRVDGELRRIEFDNILYVEGMKDYVKFHISGGKALVSHLTMKSAEDMLPSAKFMRVSRSHIVSLAKIRSVDRNMCVYIGDTIIRVTDMYREAFDDFLQRHMAR